jgi:hypothetical protein
MAIRRGYSYMTAVVPTRLKAWITRKARRDQVSRSRLLSRILEEALKESEHTTNGGSHGKAAGDA